MEKLQLHEDRASLGALLHVLTQRWDMAPPTQRGGYGPTEREPRIWPHQMGVFGMAQGPRGFGLESAHRRWSKTPHVQHLNFALHQWKEPDTMFR